MEELLKTAREFLAANGEKALARDEYWRELRERVEIQRCYLNYCPSFYKDEWMDAIFALKAKARALADAQDERLGAYAALIIDSAAWVVNDDNRDIHPLNLYPYLKKPAKRQAQRGKERDDVVFNETLKKAARETEAAILGKEDKPLKKRLALARRALLYVYQSELIGSF
ncbi:MAG: hypothetical protein LBQ52_04620 [Helicobacteraceae bacterium]|jgi:hypothetical protein|nr:hypothetical protein [Helicobacteraceae bacterium]